MRASSTDRSLICPASLVLPRVERTRPEKTIRAANFGTLCHYWAETGSTDMPGADLRDIDCLEKKILLSGVRREDWWSGGEHEVTFAINLVTEEHVRYDGPRGGADAWKSAHTPEWLTGTIDYLYDDGGVDDLKTGRWPVDPETSGQVRSYMLLPWLEAGKPFKWDRFGSITTWEKYPQHGLPRRASALITGVELIDHLENLRWAVAHPDEINPTEDGCRFCDCRELCPAFIDGDTPWDEKYERS